MRNIYSVHARTQTHTQTTFTWNANSWRDRAGILEWHYTHSHDTRYKTVNWFRGFYNWQYTETSSMCVCTMHTRWNVHVYWICNRKCARCTTLTAHALRWLIEWPDSVHATFGHRAPNTDGWPMMDARSDGSDAFTQSHRMCQQNGVENVHRNGLRNRRFGSAQLCDAFTVSSIKRASSKIARNAML